MVQNVFVSAKVADRQRAMLLMDQLRHHRFSVVGDWTTRGDINGSVCHDCSCGGLEECGCGATELLQVLEVGVRRADVLVVIDHKSLRGGLVEVGMALGRGTRVVWVNPHGNTPFVYHRLVKVVKDAGEVIGVLEELNRNADEPSAWPLRPV